MVINKLERLLEQSVESKAKADEYHEQILDVQDEITTLWKQVALAKPDAVQQTFGQSSSVQTEVMRLQRANENHKQKYEDLKNTLASKVHLKNEIEDWFAEKV